MLGCPVSEEALDHASELIDDCEVEDRQRVKKMHRHQLSLLDQSFDADISIEQFCRKSSAAVVDEIEEEMANAELDANAVVPIVNSLNVMTPARQVLPSRFKIAMRTAKYLTVFLLVMLFIKVMIIATALYFMAQITPADIKIHKIHLTGLEEACGRLSVHAELPQTFLSSWFRVVVKDIEVSVGLPSAFRGDLSDAVVRLKVPEVVVGRGGHLIGIEGIQIGFETGRSLTKLFDYLRTVDDRSHPIRIEGKARIQTNSLGIPLDFELSRSETVIAEDFLDNFDGQVDEDELQRLMKEVKLSGVQLVPGNGDRSLAVVGMVEMPRSLFGDYLTVDLPEMSLDLLHSISDSSSFVPFATV